MKTLNAIKWIVSAAALTFSAVSFGDDNKTFIGSACSFADNPLAAHSKVNHAFKNTSGGSQWVTCPVVRDFDGIAWIGLDTLGTVSSVRFEERSPLNGALTGVNAQGSTITGGTGLQHFWFSGSATHNGVDDGYYALELNLSNGASINGYRVAEQD